MGVAWGSDDGHGGVDIDYGGGGDGRPMVVGSTAVSLVADAGACSAVWRV